MNRRQFLKDLRQGLKESVDFFSPKNKLARESWVGITFLQNLGLQFDEKDVLVPLNDPPDIIFKDAQFEIKEILDPGRKRHMEFKERFRRSLKATDPADLLEPFTPHDLAPKDILDLIEKELPELGKKYPPRMRSQYDLLFYINLKHHHLKIDKMPDAFTLSSSGWRSVSALIGRGSLVYYANDLAAEFLQKKRGQLTMRQFT